MKGLVISTDDVLNTFCLANKVICIGDDEFEDVKKSIKIIQEERDTYRNLAEKEARTIDVQNRELNELRELKHRILMKYDIEDLLVKGITEEANKKVQELITIINEAHDALYERLSFCKSEDYESYDVCRIAVAGYKEILKILEKGMLKDNENGIQKN